VDIGVWVGISGVIVAVVAILTGYIWYRRSRELSERANALAEKSRLSSINLAQTADRNMGFDYFVAAVDCIQYVLCRDNTGREEDELSKAEGDSISERITFCVENGLQLLRAAVADYDLVQPVLDYVTALYLCPDGLNDPIIAPASIMQYEACRDWLHETKRMCNEMPAGGSAQRYAEEIHRQKWAAEEALNKGFTQKLVDVHNGVAVLVGTSVLELAERNADTMRSYAAHVPICERRLDSWDRRGIWAHKAGSRDQE
jgi:hypothetical protein